MPEIDIGVCGRSDNIAKPQDCKFGSTHSTQIL